MLLCVLFVLCSAARPAVGRAQLCRLDAALNRAAARLLIERERPGAEALIAAARDEGADVPRLDGRYLQDGDARARARFLERARRRMGASLVCGEAHSEGRALIIVGPDHGRIVAVDQTRLRVELLSSWSDARIEARDREGAAWRQSVRSGETVQIPSALVPPLTIQLVANGPGGPEPVAERRWGAGAVRPLTATSENIGLELARHRNAHELSALRPNRLLERVASSHAERVCSSPRPAHVIDGVDPVERLAREGIRARHVGETLARAATPAAAFTAMLRSPSHRAALEDGRFTDVGVGVAGESDERVCAVILLAAWPRPVPYRGALGRVPAR